MIDLFLFLPDRDGKVGPTGENRLERLQNVEKDGLARSKNLLTCAAVEEVEVWLMAAHPDKLRELDISVPQVRAEAKPSRGSFRAFLNKYGDDSVGQGRKRLMQEGVANLTGLLDRCQELKGLFERIKGLTLPD